MQEFTPIAVSTHFLHEKDGQRFITEFINSRTELLTDVEYLVLKACDGCTTREAAVTEISAEITGFDRAKLESVLAELEERRMVLPEIVPNRRGSLFVEPFGEETLVFNPDTNQTHAINEMASLVLSQCDGHSSIDDIVEVVGFKSGNAAGRAAVLESIRGLNSHNLLDRNCGPSANTRREFLVKGLGSAAALAVIISAGAPLPAAAASTTCLTCNQSFNTTGIPMTPGPTGGQNCYTDVNSEGTDCNNNVCVYQINTDNTRATSCSQNITQNGATYSCVLPAAAATEFSNYNQDCDVARHNAVLMGATTGASYACLYHCTTANTN
jgi:hypothetical protein